MISSKHQSDQMRKHRAVKFGVPGLVTGNINKTWTESEITQLPAKWEVWNI